MSFVYFYKALVENENGITEIKNFKALLNTPIMFEFLENIKQGQKKLSKTKYLEKYEKFATIGGNVSGLEKYKITILRNTKYVIGNNIECLQNDDAQFILLDGYIRLKDVVVNISPNNECKCKIMNNQLGSIVFPKMNNQSNDENYYQPDDNPATCQDSVMIDNSYVMLSFNNLKSYMASGTLKIDIERGIINKKTHELVLNNSDFFNMINNKNMFYKISTNLLV